MPKRQKKIPVLSSKRWFNSPLCSCNSSLMRFLLFVAYRSYHACKTAAWPENVLLKCGCAPNLVASPSSWQTHANCKLQFGSQVVWKCHLHPLAAWCLFTIWRHEDVQYVPPTRTLQHASFVARGCVCVVSPFPQASTTHLAQDIDRILQRQIKTIKTPLTTLKELGCWNNKSSHFWTFDCFKILPLVLL